MAGIALQFFYNFPGDAVEEPSFEVLLPETKAEVLVIAFRTIVF
jgi:hypothetical protein